MNKTDTGKQLHKSILISAVLAALGLIVIGWRWQYYYDLNDDMLMEQILSGKYTGVPENRNIQNLFPFSLLMSLLYRIGFDADGAGHGFGMPGFDWYALVLLLLVALCYSMTIVRILRRAGRERILAAAGVAGITLFYAAELLYHLVYVQYTVLVGLMGGTAAFLILTSEDAEDVKGFLRANIAPFALIFIGYAVRSEMMLFMLPLASLAVLFRILPLRNVKEIVLRIAASLLVLGIGVGAIYGIDTAAYSSPEWSEFRALFDARTQLYDFESIPSYEGNEDFYESIGLDASEAQLLVNYNFGIDADIDSTVLQAVADHAAELRKADTPVASKIREALWVYRHQKLLDVSEMPYNMIAFVLYGLVVITALFEILCALISVCATAAENRRYQAAHPAADGDAQDVLDAQDIRNTPAAAEVTAGSGPDWHWSPWPELPGAVWMLLEAGAILAVRSGLWLYLLYSDRPVARLTHSMYVAEGLLLLVILFYRRRMDITTSMRAAFVVCALLYAAGMQTTLVDNEAQRRSSANASYTAFLTYAGEHPDSFYVVDVYSTVDFSEKMFDNRQVMAPNWDLCGGWASKSPLETAKLAAYGISSIEEGLTSERNVYYAARSEYDTEWIVNYYASRGVKVVVNRVDMIGDYWSIYSIDTWEL